MVNHLSDCDDAQRLTGRVSVVRCPGSDYCTPALLHIFKDLRNKDTDTFILVVDSGTVFVPTARSADRLVWAWAEITLDAPPLARILRSLPFHSPLAWDSRPVCPLYLQYYDKWFMLSLNQRLFSQHLAFKIL